MTLKGSELTAEDAFGSLNFYEIQNMSKHFGVTIMQIETLAVEAMYALVWSLEIRSDPDLKPHDIKQLSFKEISEYFPEPDPLDKKNDEESSTT